MTLHAENIVPKSWITTLKSIGSMLSGVKDIFLGPVGTWAKVAAGVIKILVGASDLYSDLPIEKPSGSDYGTVMAALKSSLSALTETVRSQERQAWDAMIENVATVDKALNACRINDLSDPCFQNFSIINTLSTVHKPAPVGATYKVTIDNNPVTDINNHIEAIIENVFQYSRNQTYNVLDVTPWRCPRELCLSSTSFGKAWLEAAWALYDCLGRLSDDMTDANTRFVLAANAFFKFDMSAAATLAKYQGELTIHESWQDTQARNHQHYDDNSIGGY